VTRAEFEKYMNDNGIEYLYNEEILSPTLNILTLKKHKNKIEEFKYNFLPVNILLNVVYVDDLLPYKKQKVIS
jgi:hypothetical protein